ncbi:MAG: type II toxin-antitoxin system prevent-host-death family antitoxin [Hyphomicrobiales bacterium]|nr:type II toxin-antitoxin system prevent-host-death family antitoxin [Hyphomicrobiales bacterium]MDE2016378.1 type II toxin-antitoxin system prevent-host-death family antitoxin [Hyphomicrobiales bacterium]
MWTVQDAKAKLSQVLQRARAGEAQVIGAQNPCVVISMDEYEKLSGGTTGEHMGRWLVENLSGLGEIELPSRREDRPSPFADWEE